MIPSFILIKTLGLYNTFGAMVLPGAISVWNLVIMRTFFHSVPYELDESALMDGARDLTIFLRIVLPVSQAAMATISLFYAVGHWNSWFGAMIYLRDMARYPLQLVLRNIVIQGQMESEFVAARDFAAMESRGSVNEESIKYATICVSIVPMVVVYPFLQKYFVKGVMIGSLKG
jgi:putative aldouronate transport system permease protein